MSVSIKEQFFQLDCKDNCNLLTELGQFSCEINQYYTVYTTPS